MRDMLTPWRPHNENCTHRGEREYKKCKCPVWVMGVDDWGVFHRRTLKTTSWEDALEQIEAMRKNPTSGKGPKTVAAACLAFKDELKARNLSGDTLRKYDRLLNNLEAFCKEKGYTALVKLKREDLIAFRNTWKMNSLTSYKVQERLKSFFKAATESKWIPENPAKKLPKIEVTEPPTLPLSDDEIKKTFEAVSLYKVYNPKVPDDYLKKLYAFVLVLRYTGLAIRDVVMLTKQSTDGRKIFLHRQKTDVPVRVLVPQFVADALAACPMTSDNHYFWSGEGNPKSAVGDWQRTLRKLFTIAGVADGHAHRFRDSFAVDLLERGVPLEQVSELLGHSSIKTTRDSYRPWVAKLQAQLEDSMDRAWGNEKAPIRVP